MLPAFPFVLGPAQSGHRYQGITRIAEGGMGAVYSGHRLTGDHPPVAIKLLIDRSEKMAARFEREIAVAEGLDHPHIVRTLDHGCDVRFGPFIVMELLTGRTLDEALSGRPYGRLATEETAAIVSQICGALIYAQSRALVHRDIKTENVFVCSENPFYLKIMDFGIARAFDADEKGIGPRKKLTEAGIAVGTFRYIAPEQCLGRPGLASDVYALGVMTYLMIEGRYPFPDHLNEPEDLVAWHLHGAPEPMTACRAPALQDMVLKMLAKKPKERPNPDEIRKHLNEILNPASPPVPASPFSDAETVRITGPVPLAEAVTIRHQTPGMAGFHPKAVPVIQLRAVEAIPQVIANSDTDRTVKTQDAPPPPNWTPRAASGEIAPDSPPASDKVIVAWDTLRPRRAGASHSILVFVLLLLTGWIRKLVGNRE